MWSTISLPLLPGPLWPIVEVPDRISSMGEVDLFKNYSCSIEPCTNKKNIKKQQHKKKKIEYERKMNAIL